ncbi:phospholipase D-like domain-containing protein [Undibacterium sp. TJN25]|uniref:phospholipase D-like domain-containing protein n=1 Tax=Undibacterium sp. TJN25 TaxID=3413056 RepID=UPI003BF34BA0
MKKLIFILAIVFAAVRPIEALSSSDTKGAETGILAGPASPAIENAFSPDEGAEALVVKVINASVSTIRLAAYSFNSTHVSDALLNAKKRGVDVKVIVDSRRNQKKNNIAALKALVNAGIPVRTVSVYAIHHDKYIVSDDRTVQNGSFNYTNDAATSNSENVIVLCVLLLAELTRSV